MHAELLRITRRVGHDAFPVISQSFHASHQDMMYTQDFPAVVKMVPTALCSAVVWLAYTRSVRVAQGHAHAGYGKMKLNSASDFADFRGVIAMTGQYVTAEPYLPGTLHLSKSWLLFVSLPHLTYLFSFFV